jgi:hypothetical protein
LTDIIKRITQENRGQYSWRGIDTHAGGHIRLKLSHEPSDADSYDRSMKWIRAWRFLEPTRRMKELINNASERLWNNSQHEWEEIMSNCGRDIYWHSMNDALHTLRLRKKVDVSSSGLWKLKKSHMETKARDEANWDSSEIQDSDINIIINILNGFQDKMKLSDSLLLVEKLPSADSRSGADMRVSHKKIEQQNKRSKDVLRASKKVAVERGMERQVEVDKKKKFGKYLIENTKSLGFSSRITDYISALDEGPKSFELFQNSLNISYQKRLDQKKRSRTGAFKDISISDEAVWDYWTNRSDSNSKSFMHNFLIKEVGISEDIVNPIIDKI